MSDRRTRIITATNELFRVWGYHGTSLSQISSASQATTGSIYHFFPGGKEELTVAVIESTAAAYRDLFLVVVAGADDPVTAYADFFEAGVALLVESDFIDPCPIGSIAREVASTSEPLRLAAQAAFESWIDAVAGHLIGAGVDRDRARDLAVMIVGAVEGGFVLSRTLRDSEPLTAAARTLSWLVAEAIDRSVAAQ